MKSLCLRIRQQLNMGPSLSFNQPRGWGLKRHSCCFLPVDELRALWLEYESNSTPEAKLVKDLDKVRPKLPSLWQSHRITSAYLQVSNPPILAEYSAVTLTPTWFSPPSSGPLLCGLLSFSLSLQLEMIIQATEYEAGEFE